MKRILIMVMGCNDPFFEEQVNIVKATWAADVIAGKYSNIDFLVYKGTTDKHTFNKKNNELLVRCEDDLVNTYKKTYYAFHLVEKLYKYDYIFRTNTSTYVNVPLLNAFVQSLDDDTVCWSSDLYSLSEAMTPYPLTLYGRGNGLLLSKKLVSIILNDGINLIYMEQTDDVAIGNILNSYWMKNGVNYLNKLKAYKHGWYKCISTKADNRNSICTYYNDSQDFEFLKTFVTLQIKRYGERHLENNNYVELHDIHKANVDNNIETTVKEQFEYSENPNVFIGSILGYIPYTTWRNCDKSELYKLEVNNKASDDAERYKGKKVLY